MDVGVQLREGLAERYRVRDQIGAGGMATVYSAVELRHDREVAIKVLDPELAASLGRERFLSEIKTTARLQHPHILPLLDSGETHGLLYYVMPLVKGETLRSRLARERQLPVDEAVRIARQVCDALSHAHQHGIIHRDIKPENILLQTGHALVADFGVALAVERAGGTRLTQTGMSLGTPSYMSPEQATGDQLIDARTDVYAMGVVTYEMLVGEPPFRGTTAQAVLAKVITERPSSPSAFRDTVSLAIDEAVLTALAKVPADRQATIAQFADALEARPARSHAGGRASGAYSRVALLGVALPSLMLGFAAGRLLPRGDAAPVTAGRYYSVLLPEQSALALTGPTPMGTWQTALAISPGGETVVYSSPREGTTHLVARRLDRDTTYAIGGTDGAYFPFYSPAGDMIAFFSGRELRKIPAQGGSALTLAQVDRPTGAVWVSPDSILLFEEDGFTMRLIRSTGGDATAPRRLTTQFGTPDILPGNEWVVGQLSSGQLGLLSLRDTSLFAISRRGVIPVDSVGLGDITFGTSPRWVEASGHLVYGTGDGVLMALPFDGANRRVTGQPVSIVNGVRMEDGFGYAEFGVSAEGTLVYVPGNNQLYGRIALFDASGRLDTLPFPRGAYTQLRASPDGGQLAIQQRSTAVGWEIVRYDFSTGVRTRVPVEGNYRAFPAAWRPPGRELLLGLWDPVRFLFLGARLQPLFGGAAQDFPFHGISYLSFNPAGTHLSFSDWRTGDLYMAAIEGDTTRTRVPGRGFASSFSTDGRWLAYGDVEGGISVSPVPPTGEIIRAIERGAQPLWSPDGRSLIFLNGRQFYQSTILPGNRFRLGPPTLIGEGPFVRTFAWNHSIAADGRLIVSVNSPERTTRELRLITGLPAELRRLASPSQD
jgi:serine/threonine-protein kinase